MMRFAIGLVSAAVMLAVPTAVPAKRKPPPDVPPVVHGGIEYKVVHFGKARNLGQNGGIVEAVDQKTGKSLWVLKVYEVKYDEKREADVQDVFLVSMVLDAEAGAILVENEAGKAFRVDLTTRGVAPVEAPAK